MAGSAPPLCISPAAPESGDKVVVSLSVKERLPVVTRKNGQQRREQRLTA